MSLRRSDDPGPDGPDEFDPDDDGTEPITGESDAETYDRLAAQNFTGNDQEVYEAELVAYALAVLVEWIANGKIYLRCAEKGRRIQPTDHERNELLHDVDERTELAYLTVAQALVWFRAQALRGGGWRPDGGCSLRSYFVGACILRYPDEFRRWRRSRRQPPTLGYGVDAAGVLDGQSPHRGFGPAEDHVADEVTHHQEMDDMPPRIRAIVQGRLDGRTHAEIGEDLGLTARAVEGLLHRYRRHRGGRS